MPDKERVPTALELVKNWRSNADVFDGHRDHEKYRITASVLRGCADELEAANNQMAADLVASFMEIHRDAAKSAEDRLRDRLSQRTDAYLADDYGSSVGDH